MAIDDPLDAIEDLHSSDRRAEGVLTPYIRDLSEIMSAMPAELVPAGLSGPLDIAKSMVRIAGFHLRKIEDSRRRELINVVVPELRWLTCRVAELDDRHKQFIREELSELVLDALQKAERTRSKQRIERMGKILGASAKAGPQLPSDEIEELLRISMELADIDVKVLALLVDGQRESLSSPRGMLTPGAANKFWQRAGRIDDLGGASEIAAQASISDGALQSACAKLQAYGLLVQVERDESKLPRGTILYAILPRAVTFIEAIGAQMESGATSTTH